jgi:hypothetical protein
MLVSHLQPFGIRVTLPGRARPRFVGAASMTFAYSDDDNP